MICCLVWRGAASVVVGVEFLAMVVSGHRGRGMRPFYRDEPRRCGAGLRGCTVQIKSRSFRQVAASISWLVGTSMVIVMLSA